MELDLKKKKSDATDWLDYFIVQMCLYMVKVCSYTKWVQHYCTQSDFHGAASGIA